jgi:hypothetical protein
MAFITKRIQNMFVDTPDGQLVLSGKAGEDPELKLFVNSVEDTDDGLTNDNQLLITDNRTRSYIQGVFAYADADIPLINAAVQQAIQTGGLAPANVVCTDGTIYSNTGTFVGDIVYNGTGTQELKFAAAADWIQS